MKDLSGLYLTPGAKALSLLFALYFLTPAVAAFGFSLNDAAQGASTIIETYDRVSNKYFYAAIGLLMVTLPALGKIKQGGQMRPVMAKATAYLLHTINIICILLLALHFAPETGGVIKFLLNAAQKVF